MFQRFSADSANTLEFNELRYFTLRADAGFYLYKPVNVEGNGHLSLLNEDTIRVKNKLIHELNAKDMSERTLTIFDNDFYTGDYVADISSDAELYQGLEVELSTYYKNNLSVFMKVNLSRSFLNDATSDGLLLKDARSVWSEAIEQTGF
ncbi:hypothetical protein Sps_03255 [Shewanella psychrophila]|uniref:Uncharacterized protein n=1 Tax=Shewanella psychrophila TaxID=225848 RepID=A0A1S6HS71_9GAMM|nr:hypothetical protein [Shewanella psychrophila]AQS38397.1 hypothetical protein Sps_03255 [Shewanella psychrophila]